MTQPDVLPEVLPPPRPRTRRWRRIVLALLIFIGGAACGAGIATVVIVRSVQHSMRHPELAPARVTDRLTRRLDLTPAQADQVRQIIRTRQQSLLDIRRDVQPRVDMQLTALEDEIDAVLNDEQREKWRALVQQFRKTWLPPMPTTRMVEE